MDLQQIINSSWGIQLASGLARAAPPNVGYRLARMIANFLAGRGDAKVVRAMRLNQWMAHQGNLDGAALDAAVRASLHCSARAIFDLHHYIEDFEATGKLITLDPGAQTFVRRPEFAERGLVAAGLHMSNFDLVLQWMCKQGLKPLVLTIPEPRGGRRVEYEARKKIGMNLVPTSLASLRQAVKHLQQGGVVITGVDRPIENPPMCPRLFGYPAALPVHYAYLAQKAQVPVHLFAVLLQPDGRYHVISSEPIEMERDENRDRETIRNAEKVLSIAETMIQKAAEQWLVPLPVWPDRMSMVPSPGPAA